MLRSARATILAFTVLLGGVTMPSLARAQDRDATFCSMLGAIHESAPERVGDVVSGTVGEARVSFRRDVVAPSTYVLLVALSAAATEASVMPVERAGDEAPHREGTRIAHDFSARASGVVTISFRAPRGTTYHAALYRLPPPRESSLGVRPFAMALHDGGGLGSMFGEPARPPDCRPPASSGMGSGSVMGSGGRSPEPRLGRIVIHGSMPRAEVTRVLTGNRAQLAFCATSHGSHALTLRLLVAPTGTVQAASSDGPAPLSTCIARSARRWRFPSTGAGVTTIDVPISFDPAP